MEKALRAGQRVTCTLGHEKPVLASVVCVTLLSLQKSPHLDGTPLQLQLHPSQHEGFDQVEFMIFGFFPYTFWLEPWDASPCFLFLPSGKLQTDCPRYVFRVHLGHSLA